jgi:hypothetical protein
MERTGAKDGDPWVSGALLWGIVPDKHENVSYREIRGKVWIGQKKKRQGENVGRSQRISFPSTNRA